MSFGKPIFFIQLDKNSRKIHPAELGDEKFPRDEKAKKRKSPCKIIINQAEKYPNCKVLKNKNFFDAKFSQNFETLEFDAVFFGESGFLTVGPFVQFRNLRAFEFL